MSNPFDEALEATPPFQEQAGPKPWFDLDAARIGSWLTTPPPPRRWLIDGIVPAGKNLLLVAPGGSSKSMFAVQLALSIATGRPFLGKLPVGETGAVLLLAAEDDQQELHRRFYHAVKALTHGDSDEGQYVHSLIRDRIFVRSLVGERNLLTGRLHDQVFQTERVDQLIVTANRIQNLRVIIVDPLARFQGGQENASEDLTRFVETLEHVVQETGAAVFAIHHANKASMVAGVPASQGAARGSSALTDGVRWQGNLSVMSEVEARKMSIQPADRKNLVSFAVTKSNYGPPIPDMWLRRGDHGVLHVADLHPAKDEEDTAILARIVEILKRYADDGKEFSKNAFEQQFGGLNGEIRCAEKRLRDVIATALEEGVLQLRPPRNPTRSVREILAVVEPGDDAGNLPGWEEF